MLAVTAATREGTLSPGSCSESELFPPVDNWKIADLAVVIADNFSLGRNTGDVIEFGGSSTATALASGIAALVWSKYPSWSRDQVKSRLLSSTTPAALNLGHGLLNAFAATGGLARIEIRRPKKAPVAGTPYVLRAVPNGDGPTRTGGALARLHRLSQSTARPASG